MDNNMIKLTEEQKKKVFGSLGNNPKAIARLMQKANRLKSSGAPMPKQGKGISRYQGGLMGFQEGGVPKYPVGGTPEEIEAYNKKMREISAENQQSQGELIKKTLDDPTSQVTKPEVEKIDPNAEGTNIAEGTGQVKDPFEDITTKTAESSTVDAPKDLTTTTVDPTKSAADVEKQMDKTKAATGEVSEGAKIDAVTVDPTKTKVADIPAAQGEGILMDNPVQREIQEGELISGAADANKAAKFTEEVQAATATPTKQATVAGQLEGLMAQFEGGATPAWAAGAMRNAMGAMAARGLSSSSMAGQAIIQAAMESALPIAQADAQTVATFEKQNLSNRQQRAMLAAQQRAEFIGQEFNQEFQARVQNAAKIADVANMNFTAEQQVALENSRIANTMEIANLSNRQAMVMAQAASISALEQQNLSNEQQAAVQNAQNFMQMDLANLSNEQQTAMFKAQSSIQAIFNDQASDNAAKQFNATSENQTKQFMTNLKTQVDQFNSSQSTAISQFNAGQENAIAQYNSTMNEQRDQFNATNSLVVAQANAQWRQNTSTINTASQNEANRVEAQAANAYTQATMDQIWQRERDLMSFAFQSSESSADRTNAIVLQKMAADATIDAAAFQAEIAAAQQEGSGWSKIISWITGISR